MTHTIVNLALPVIASKVEELLDSYPEVPHQAVFASATLREELVAYVLRRVPTVYTTTPENLQACMVSKPVNCFSKEQHSRMDALIHEGINHLLDLQTEWQEAAQQATRNYEPTPSNWFG